MVLQSDSHIFGGMQKDQSPYNQEGQYLCDAMNIRLTAKEGDTQLTVTNERGTTYCKEVGGHYLGHCVINDFAVVFTKGVQLKALIKSTNLNPGTADSYELVWQAVQSQDTNRVKYTLDGLDGIFKLYKENDEWQVEALFVGNLNFNKDYRIETIGVYESDKIQKVYWVDGLNQPRMLIVDNVKFPFDKVTLTPTDNGGVYVPVLTVDGISTQFDFVQSLKLEEEVEIERLEGQGQFNPGVIQYAFSYYNLYGQQSNIFHTTPLQYISFSDRGGKGDETVANIFKITITGLETSFDFLRVYSIQRTSIDGIAIAKRLLDLEIGDNTSLTFMDDGTIGDSMDPTELLYIGGEDIVASTMTSKDSSLFLGNLKLNRLEPLNITFASNTTTTVQHKEVEGGDSASNPYFYKIGLKHPTRGFKNREHYRLGVQFQHKTGKWSMPVPLEDFTVSSDGLHNPNLSFSDGVISIDNLILNTEITLNSDTLNTLKEQGYLKARPVCVFPTMKDRLVLTQGLLCPTVYNYEKRLNNTPFAQSSWFFRPNPNIAVDRILESTYKTGRWLEFRQDHLLRGGAGGEIMFGNATGVKTTSTNFASVDTMFDYAIDNSILTMHSPEVEFDTRVNYMQNNQWKMRIVGLTNITATYGTLDIQVSTPSKIGHFNELIVNNIESSGYDNTSLKGIVGGPFWEDNIVYTDGGDYKTTDVQYKFMVYPWHKSGSLNNDVIRPTDKGTRTAELKTKILGNYRFSRFNTWLDTPIEYPISPIDVFDDLEVSLHKIGNINYYGNVDTGLTSDVALSTLIYKDNGSLENVDNVQSVQNATKEGTSMIRMSYKSSKHIAFQLSELEILPTVNSLNGDTNIAVVPDWIKTEQEDSLQDVKEIDYSGLSWRNGLRDLQAEFAAGNLGDNPNDKIVATLLSKNPSYNFDGNLLLHKIEVRGSSISWTDFDVSSHLYYKLRSLHSNAVNLYKPHSRRAEGAPYNSSVEFIGHATSSNNLSYSQRNISVENLNYPYIFLGELYREPIEDVDFGGKTTDAYLRNIWYPAGKPVSLDSIDNDTLTIQFTEGDTFYQRYDCLKTFPFTEEHENSVIEIGSFLCETRVNIDGISDRNKNVIGNLLNIRKENFNLLNDVYSQQDNFFNYNMIRPDIDVNDFANQFTFTSPHQAGNETDNWTKISLTNNYNVDGVKGGITALRAFNDHIFCFQPKGICELLYNSRTAIPTSDGVPIEIASSAKYEGHRYIIDNIGCDNKWSICITVSGIYFIDNISGNLYNIGGESPVNVSDTKLFGSWFRNKMNTDDERTYYDFKNNDLYLVWEDDTCLVFSEKLGQFTSFMSYEEAHSMFNIGSTFFALHNSGNMCTFYEVGTSKYHCRIFGKYYPFWLSFISNANSATTKVFSTVESRADFWKEIWNDNTYVKDELQHNLFFDYIRASNEYQDSGYTYTTKSYTSGFKHAPLSSSNRKKFRVWRTDIPRDKERKFDRMRNPWVKIELGMVAPNDSRIPKADLERLITDGVLPPDFIPDKYYEGMYEELEYPELAEAVEEMESSGESVVEEQGTLQPRLSTADYIRTKMKLHNLNVQYYI